MSRWYYIEAIDGDCVFSTARLARGIDAAIRAFRRQHPHGRILSIEGGEAA